MTKAFHHISAKRDVPVFFFGDHASRIIPPEMNNLGLSGDDLTRHIAWDIGTETIIRDLCAHYGCAGQVAGVSRLVIDLNRDVAMDSCIPKISDNTLIPGNQNLSATARQDRIDRYHTPYHAALSHAIDMLADPLVISVHSFTPKTRAGDIRNVDIGLLVKHDMETAKALETALLQHNPEFVVGINEPYSAYDLNYTVDIGVAEKGLRHLALEINQSHIDNDDKAHTVAAILAKRLGPIIDRKI